MCRSAKVDTSCPAAHWQECLCYRFAKGPVVFMPMWPNFIFLAVCVSVSLSFFFLMFEKYNRTVFSAWGYLHVLKLHFKLSLFLI